MDGHENRGRGPAASIEAMMSEYREMRANLDEMQQQLLGVRASAYSEDGLVIATVGPRGHLVDVQIDPMVYRRPNTKELSRAIVEAAQGAVDLVVDQVDEITRRYAPQQLDVESLQSYDITSLFKRTDADLLDGS